MHASTPSIVFFPADSSTTNSADLRRKNKTLLIALDVDETLASYELDKHCPIVSQELINAILIFCKQKTLDLPTEIICCLFTQRCREIVAKKFCFYGDPRDGYTDSIRDYDLQYDPRILTNLCRILEEQGIKIAFVSTPLDQFMKMPGKYFAEYLKDFELQMVLGKDKPEFIRIRDGADCPDLKLAAISENAQAVFSDYIRQKGTQGMHLLEYLRSEMPRELQVIFVDDSDKEDTYPAFLREYEGVNVSVVAASINKSAKAYFADFVIIARKHKLLEDIFTSSKSEQIITILESKEFAALKEYWTIYETNKIVLHYLAMPPLEVKSIEALFVKLHLLNLLTPCLSAHNLVYWFARNPDVMCLYLSKLINFYEEKQSEDRSSDSVRELLCKILFPTSAEARKYPGKITALIAECAHIYGEIPIYKLEQRLYALNCDLLSQNLVADLSKINTEFEFFTSKQFGDYEKFMPNGLKQAMLKKKKLFS